MKKLIILGLVVLFMLWLNPLTRYNQLVTLQENVKGAWTQVENQYQRRSDLVPNLVETVKGSANFEQTTLTQVIEARAKATQNTINLQDPASLAAFQQAQGELSSALARLMVTVEQYPELKSVARFGDLQVQLEGSENRISTERMRYNEAVRDYNLSLRSFPNNLWARLFGFQPQATFEAQSGAEKAPEVKF